MTRSRDKLPAMSETGEYTLCKVKFENIWEHNQEYYCNKTSECCSTAEDWSGCCPKKQPIWRAEHIETEYIVAIAAVVFVIIVLVIVGICVIARKRKRRRTSTPLRPSAPPDSEMSPYPSPVPPRYSQGNPPPYSEAVYGYR